MGICVAVIEQPALLAPHSLASPPPDPPAHPLKPHAPTLPSCRAPNDR